MRIDMITLNFQEMEMIEGGAIDCETSTGVGLGVLAGALIITAATGGAAGWLLLPAIAIGNDMISNCLE